jgi:hypothetical protein
MTNKALALCVLGVLGTTVFAQGTQAPKGPVMTAEQRQKMADAHEKMAVCLRSERPVPDCHDELMKGCKETMGATMCPMMGGGMGPMRHGGKVTPPPGPTK